MKKILGILSVLVCFSLASCEGVQETQYVLIGDSLCEHWNAGYYLPALNIENRGVIGLRIEDCRTRTGNLSGRPVILLVGTNDIAFTDENKVKEVCNRYMSLVRDIRSEHIYCISVLPKFRQYNSAVKAFNAAISEQVGLYGHVTYVDVYDAFEHEGVLNPNYTTDGLHLNYKGYELLSGLLLKAIQ